LYGIPVYVDIASEFRYREPLVDNKTLAIYISQSGETADTLAAIKLSKKMGAKTLVITNVVGSSAAREADYSIYTNAGPEIAVASTKAYTSQIVLLTILAIYLAEILDKKENLDELELLKEDILKLPLKLEGMLNNSDKIKNFAKRVSTEKDMFFLGRGVDYAVSLEGSLKLKEISYIHSEAYASGELKHGPIALIEEDVTVVAVITDAKLAHKTISNIQEVIARGAKILVVTNQKLNEEEFAEVIKVPETNILISAVLSVVPLQLFSYYVTKEKGLDVDKPRNLAKSVTVE
jgi:glucosamine--fructose-6-phosphate aminotransferase (isomerizing)